MTTLMMFTLQTHYNVVFFDEKDVTRAWLTPGAMRPFTGYENSKEFRTVSFLVEKQNANYINH